MCHLVDRRKALIATWFSDTVENGLQLVDARNITARSLCPSKSSQLSQSLVGIVRAINQNKQSGVVVDAPLKVLQQSYNFIELIVLISTALSRIFLSGVASHISSSPSKIY